VERLFTLDEAQALLDAELRPLAEQMVALSADGRRAERRWKEHLMAVAGNGGNIDRRAVVDASEAVERIRSSLSGLVEQIVEHGVQVKDIDRGLLDFPARVRGEDALLCWQVGEERIAWWHTPEAGFAGRQPLPGAE